MIRKNEKKTANEVINAFNTGRSFQSKNSSHPSHPNLKIVDNIPQIRVSQMRLNSGDTAKREPVQQMVGNALFEIHQPHLPI